MVALTDAQFQTPQNSTGRQLCQRCHPRKQVGRLHIQVQCVFLLHAETIMAFALQNRCHFHLKSHGV
jgi:hypothetical protein